jgi:hypothetical protein
LKKLCNQLKNDNKKLRQDSNKISKGKINSFWDSTQGQVDYGARIKQIEFDFMKFNDIEKNSLKLSVNLDKSNVIVKRLLESEVNLGANNDEMNGNSSHQIHSTHKSFSVFFKVNDN